MVRNLTNSPAVMGAMILSKPNAADYRHEADRLLAEAKVTHDGALRQELLQIAHRYERLASYAAVRERARGWFITTDDDDDRNDNLSNGLARA